MIERQRWAHHSLTKMRVTVVSVILWGASLCLGSAVAQADPVDLEPQIYHKTSRDGWKLTIRIDNEKVNAVPNLAAASNSREAFVTFNSTATASGGSSPITDSIFVAGYQLGCQTDVSSGLQIGGAVGVSPQASIGAGGGAPGSVSLGASGGIAGFAQAVLQPGVIVDLPLANMALNDGGTAMLDVDNLHIKADACGGDVTIRSYVYQRISTAVAHTQFAIYGTPIKI